MLIVEDFDVVRETLCDLLAHSYGCRAVRTAEEGLDLLGREPIDVVITDVKLPGMGGAEFLAEARRRQPGLPVIVVTGGVEGMAERDFMELGAFGYLLKPFSAGEVERLVGRALECGRECGAVGKEVP